RRACQGRSSRTRGDPAEACSGGTPPMPQALAARTHTLRIIAQDPAVKVRGRILTARVEVPAEELAAGPWGDPVPVIDSPAPPPLQAPPLRPRRRRRGPRPVRENHRQAAAVRPPLPRPERLRHRDAHPRPLRAGAGPPRQLELPGAPAQGGAPRLRRRQRLLL